MAEDSGSEQPQKTVAELLAQHGAKPEGGRRRRRRAADDDVVETPEPGGSRRKPTAGDTGPQAIIDRVAGGATPPPPAPAPPAPPAPAPPVRRAQPQPEQPAPPRQRQDSGAFRVKPPVHQDSGQLPRPQDSAQLPRPQDSAQLPRPQDSAQLPRPQDSAQLPRPQMPPPGVPPHPQDSGQLPVPPRGRGPRQQQPPPPVSQEETRRRITPARPRGAQPPADTGALSSRLDGLDTEPEVAPPPPPPAPGGMGSGTFQSPQAPPRRPRRQPARQQPKPEDYTEQIPTIIDDIPPAAPPVPPAAAAPPPPAPVVDEPPAGLAGWRKKRKAVAMDDTEVGVMPAVPVDQEPQLDTALLDGGPPTQYSTPPSFAPQRAMPREDPFDDEPLDLNAPPGRLDDQYDYDDDPLVDDYEDEYDAEPVAEEEEPPPAEEEGSPGKQWLALAWQLAAGVVGGAAVWLGFNWLWVKLPAAALIAALLVVVGLVWIVRKIRRAEDLQTTVLAVLVGLVVTVSPAALLLLSR
ncbi:hypothetical protein AB5J62_01335 [Amycolatopsis sp. cg5]|uniref:hypothetical protein n=1 Tax=Amycolatopsis sp. cg5 TaxID=3238802 RepID=UPI0035231D11